MKKISIITPVYNQEELIIRMLDSIPRRSDIELILIDDCSTDNTREKIINYIKNLNIEFTVLFNSKNIGCAASLNIGIEHSKGEYILQLDSDDYLLTDKFNTFMNEIYENHEDLIFFDNIVNDGTIFSPAECDGYCDHICLYKKSIIGDTRYKEQRCAAGLQFHKTILAKKHDEKYYNKVIYYYNYPREGSNYDLFKKGLLKP